MGYPDASGLRVSSAARIPTLALIAPFEWVRTRLPRQGPERRFTVLNIPDRIARVRGLPPVVTGET